jgi:hypothetical protein
MVRPSVSDTSPVTVPVRASVWACCSPGMVNARVRSNGPTSGSGGVFAGASAGLVRWIVTGTR